MAASLALVASGVPSPAHANPAGDAEEDAKSSITVTAKRGPAVVLDRLTLTAAEAPQAITEISRGEIERRGVTNLNDALRNVAGLTPFCAVLQRATTYSSIVRATMAIIFAILLMMRASMC